MPIYQQIRDRIISLIDKGLLKEGSHLPPSRDLARNLDVNRSTVYKAYRELWSLGFVDSRPGSYSTVRRKRPEFRKEMVSCPSPVWIDSLPSVENLHGSKFLNRHIPFDFRPLSPDPDLIPTDDYRRCYNDVLKEKGRGLMGYGHPSGYGPLLDYIGEMMCRNRVHPSRKEMMITSGAHNALDLLCKLFRKEKWSVISENPGYSEAIALFRHHGAEVTGCPIGEAGMDLKRLQMLLENQRPAFVYTMPNYQNPTGYSSSQSNREELLALCEMYGVPLIEDGFSEDMRGTIFPVKSMDRNHMVIYIGTFSKVLFPGIRTGWIYGHSDLIKKLVNLQYISRIAGNIPAQAALERFCRLGYYDLHLKRIHKIYRRRMDCALKALERHFPDEAGFYTKPSGGYSLWFSLSSVLISEAKLLESLLEKGIAVSPGSPSLTTHGAEVTLRLSIAHRSEKEIERGLELMCRIIKKIIREREDG